MKARRFLSFVLVLVLLLSCSYSRVYARISSYSFIKSGELDVRQYLYVDDVKYASYTFSDYKNGNSYIKTSSGLPFEESASLYKNNYSFSHVIYMSDADLVDSILDAYCDYNVVINNVVNKLNAVFTSSSGVGNISNSYYLSYSYVDSVLVRAYDSSGAFIGAKYCDFNYVADASTVYYGYDLEVDIPYFSQDVYKLEIYLNYNVCAYNNGTYNVLENIRNTALVYVSSDIVLGFNSADLSCIKTGDNTPLVIEQETNEVAWSIFDVISNMFSSIVNLPSNLWNKMSTSFTNLINGNTNIFTEVANVFSAVNSLPKQIWNYMSDSFSSLATHAYNIYSSVTSLPGQIWAQMQGAFTDLSKHALNIWIGVTSLPGQISSGIHDLFVPSSDYLENYAEKFQLLLISRFGALYQSFHFVADFVNQFENKAATDVIDIPITTVSLPEVYGDGKVEYSFGGYQVDVVPDGIEAIVEILKWVISAVCTLAFVNSLKNRIYNEFLGGG